MQLIKKGKTKDVYRLPNNTILLKFKDAVTGGADGMPDPGGNLVVGEKADAGLNALKVSKYFFEILKKKKIPTHYVSADVSKNEMTVRPATIFGKGLEVVIRYMAVGSFARRYALYVSEGDPICPPVLEVTIKDDERNDPPINKNILASLNIMTPKQLDDMRAMGFKIANIVREECEKKGMVLYDIKLEFGIVDGKLALIDEISAGNMRAYVKGKVLSYNELSERILK
ncbi:MAG: phosphoribosylaminoimidazolesuccinocarboxamide synthase [Firmicutes bacterium]|nr:phosphoribosylaminoimidazolesuccinocarboxamide synthase [Bacillota bacterium]